MRRILRCVLELFRRDGAIWRMCCCNRRVTQPQESPLHACLRHAPKRCLPCLDAFARHIQPYALCCSEYPVSAAHRHVRTADNAGGACLPRQRMTTLACHSALLRLVRTSATARCRLARGWRGAAGTRPDDHVMGLVCPRLTSYRPGRPRPHTSARPRHHSAWLPKILHALPSARRAAVSEDSQYGSLFIAQRGGFLVYRGDQVLADPPFHFLLHR